MESTKANNIEKLLQCITCKQLDECDHDTKRKDECGLCKEFQKDEEKVARIKQKLNL